MSLEARIWASRLDLRLEGVDGGEEEEGEEGEISPVSSHVSSAPSVPLPKNPFHFVYRT